jgi:hypothetical protein
MKMIERFKSFIEPLIIQAFDRFVKGITGLTSLFSISD